MHKVRTPWPAATRVQYTVAFQGCCRRWPGLSASRFCAVAEIPYSTFARWCARWQREGNRALLNRPRRPRHCPSALRGRVLDVIRQGHRQLAVGVRRLHAHLSQAKLITCSLSSVYRVLRRWGAHHRDRSWSAPRAARRRRRQGASPSGTALYVVSDFRTFSAIF
jgi:transposase